MRAAIIENGVVINIAEATPEFAAAQGWVVSDTAAIGDLYDGETFTKPLPDASVQWDTVRQQRNNLLAATDWWVTKAAEAGELITPEQRTYRQALRDVTLQPDPFNIVWPEMPA